MSIYPLNEIARELLQLNVFLKIIDVDVIVLIIPKLFDIRYCKFTWLIDLFE